ncbi:MAG: DNA topology modulation protein [Alphaproteobacteria bacterium]
MRAQKIMIFGRPGSGKSTYALKLHKEFNIRIYHLDRYFFIENWQERSRAEFLKIQQNIIQKDSWIIDGNSLNSLEVRYSRADICIYFNYNRIICFLRLIKRLLYKQKEILDRAYGCNEGISFKLLHYMWRFEKKVENKISMLRYKFPNVKFFEVQNDKNLEDLVL